MAWTEDKIQQVYQEVLQRAATDEAFRKEILTDTKNAIEKISGEELPEDVKIHVIENDPEYNATFVLPPLSGEELDDEVLEEVTGGMCMIDACGGKACAADLKLKLFEKSDKKTQKKGD